MTHQILAAATLHVGGGEKWAFYLLAPSALIGAFGMVLARNAIHSALFLVLTMLSLGVFYIIQSGPFIGLAQIIVYTGAIMMLFLFVLMLVGRDASDSVVEVLRGQRLAGGILGIGLAGLLVGALAGALPVVADVPIEANNVPAGNVGGLGKLIFTQ